MAIDQLGQYDNINVDIEKMNSLREIEHGIVASAKIKDGYQCCWCRRILQQPAGLLRHRSYCSWNPALRPTTEEKRMTSKQEMTVIDGVKACDPTKVSLQCEWCNRFFSNERGVIRHKAYCAWHPQRLKTLKEERKRRRIEKAVFKKTREDARMARQFENTKKSDLVRTKHEIENDGSIKTEPMDTSLPSSPSSSVGSPTSPTQTIQTPTLRYNQPIKREYSSPRYNVAAPFFFANRGSQARVDPEILKRPAVFSCQTTVRLSKPTPKPCVRPSAIRVPVITSCDFLCGCGCKKISSGITPSKVLQRKSSIVDSPQSYEEDDDDDDEIINVDT